MSLSVVLVATFLASCVEAVEAVTIVVGVGVTRGWRSVWPGVLAALAALAALVALFGAALAILPIGPLRLGVGALLLVFGLGWLRKGIRRVAVRGLRGDVFAEEIPDSGVTGVVDWPAFVVAFKAVLLEGLEVAFIVVTLGAPSGHLGPAVMAGLGASVLVALAGFAVHPVLRRVPRSLFILLVGLMLSSFGTFWTVEGLGVGWPGADGAIPALFVLYALAGFVLLLVERRWHRRNVLLPA